MKKTCPKCSRKAVKLYRFQTVGNKRKWIPTVWYCTECSYIYQVASDTLLFKSGEEVQSEEIQSTCPKCDKKLVRIYRHINPKHGKQQWKSIGWYCNLCKYAWIEKQKEEEHITL